MKQERTRHAFCFLFVFFVFYLIFRFSGRVSYVYSVIYNTLILIMSVLFLKKDFNVSILRYNWSDLSLLPISFTLAFLFSIVVIMSFLIFQDVSLLPFFFTEIALADLVFFFFVQIIIAFSEEALFRFYFYEWMFAHIRKECLSVLIISLAFALLHFVMHGRLKQVVISFVFSIFAFIIKKQREVNSFYCCSFTHLFYNIFAQFLFSI